jgi:hypothetical protein
MMTFENIPLSLLIVLLIRAFWIVAFFGFIQYILLKAIRNERMHDIVEFYNPLVRNVTWVLFTIHVIYDLVKVNPIVSLAVLGTLLALGWQPARDFIQGTIFRFQKGDIKGQLLKVKKYHGIINKMHNTKIELTGKDGEILQIPYSRIISEVTTKPASAKELKTGNVIIRLPADSNIEQTKIAIKEKLLNLPWIVSSKGVNIEKLDDIDGVQRLKVVFSTLNFAYIDQVRRLLEG